MKQCSGCGVTKPHSEYWRKASSSDGLYGQCKPCASEAKRRRRAADPERSRAREREWYARNAETIRARGAVLRDTPERREAARQRTRAWGAANKERKRAADRAYREANRDYYLAYLRNWYVQNVDHVRAYWADNRERARAHQKTRKARLRGAAVRDLTAKEWAEIKQEFLGLCAYCCEPCDPITLDHMTPVSRGGHHTRSNVVPACASCNSSKRERTLLEFIANVPLRRPGSQRLAS